MGELARSLTNLLAGAPLDLPGELARSPGDPRWTDDEGR
jgi:hypothetical protein